ncbi:Phage protein [Salmonella enterica subsp. enterica serovar Rissen]|nr:putative phage protein [Salmonella enterica subsp. enterica serovar Senftenberg str. A4-543]CAK4058585.1 Phage protein [Salmonella enterica subsp. enterica serovar Rissen]
MWDAWKGARAAIEIKLDDKVMVEDEFDKGHNCAIDYCAEAIRAAGIKVKE